MKIVSDRKKDKSKQSNWSIISLTVPNILKERLELWWINFICILFLIITTVPIISMCCEHVNIKVEKR